MSIHFLKIIFFYCIILITQASCATLNKDECITANWKLIGYEDGSKGYPASRIGSHREACAEYKISPNLDLYNKGRAEGLHKYCLPIKAFNLGRNGGSYNGVCSGYNEEVFITAYKQGKQIYGANVELSKMNKALDIKREALDHIIENIHNNEQLIIDGKLSNSKIVALLLETRNLAVEQNILIKEVEVLKADIKKQSSYISHLKQQYYY